MNDQSALLLEHHLKELKLPSFLREYEKMAAQCAAEGVDHPQYLLRLAELELIDRHQRMVERRVRAARFPAVKSLDTFDFPAIPSLNKALVMELARCEYIQRRENVIAVGNSGTGKTHVALGMGLARNISTIIAKCEKSFGLRYMARSNEPLCHTPFGEGLALRRYILQNTCAEPITLRAMSKEKRFDDQPPKETNILQLSLRQ